MLFLPFCIAMAFSIIAVGIVDEIVQSAFSKILSSWSLDFNEVCVFVLFVSAPAFSFCQFLFWRHFLITFSFLFVPLMFGDVCLSEIRNSLIANLKRNSRLQGLTCAHPRAPTCTRGLDSLDAHPCSVLCVREPSTARFCHWDKRKPINEHCLTNKQECWVEWKIER